MTLDERFWAKVQPAGPFECWLWLGYVTPSGYGRFSAGGHGASPVQAHRMAYELLVGEIPVGLELDHLCRVTLCVNPWHLDPVTHDVNLARTRGIPRPNRRGPRGPQQTPRRSRVESPTTTSTR